MTQITVKQQLEAIESVTKEALKSKESALKFLVDAGIVKNKSAMTQKPFTTDKGEFLAIELPEDAPGRPEWIVRVFGHRIVRHNDQIVFDDKLPSGNWQIITPNASEATEEQAREIVDVNSRGRYTDYYYDHVGFDLAKNSLQSLLRKHGLTEATSILQKSK